MPDMRYTREKALKETLDSPIAACAMRFLTKKESELDAAIKELIRLNNESVVYANRESQDEKIFNQIRLIEGLVC